MISVPAGQRKMNRIIELTNLASTQGNQLRRDLNVIVGRGNNWEIPAFWSPLLRYVAGPILAIVFGFSYPAFYKLRIDPLHILGFAIGHIALLIVAFGFIVPRWYDVIISPSRRGEGRVPYAPGVAFEAVVSSGNSDALESGEGEGKVVVDPDTQNK